MLGTRERALAAAYESYESATACDCAHGSVPDIVDAVLASVPRIVVVEYPGQRQAEAEKALAGFAEREGVTVLCLPQGWSGEMLREVEVDGTRYVEAPL